MRWLPCPSETRSRRRRVDPRPRSGPRDPRPRRDPAERDPRRRARGFLPATPVARTRTRASRSGTNLLFEKKTVGHALGRRRCRTTSLHPDSAARGGSPGGPSRDPRRGRLEIRGGDAFVSVTSSSGSSGAGVSVRPLRERARFTAPRWRFRRRSFRATSSPPIRRASVRVRAPRRVPTVRATNRRRGRARLTSALAVSTRAARRWSSRLVRAKGDGHRVRRGGGVAGGRWRSFRPPRRLFRLLRPLRLFRRFRPSSPPSSPRRLFSPIAHSFPSSRRLVRPTPRRPRERWVKAGGS